MNGRSTDTPSGSVTGYCSPVSFREEPDQCSLSGTLSTEDQKSLVVLEYGQRRQSLGSSRELSRPLPRRRGMNSDFAEMLS